MKRGTRLRTHPQAAEAVGLALQYLGADGSLLYATVQGAGPLVILLHGGGPDHRSLLPLASRLADVYTVAVPDVWGYGCSVWSTRPPLRQLGRRPPKVSTDPGRGELRLSAALSGLYLYLRNM